MKKSFSKSLLVMLFLLLTFAIVGCGAKPTVENVEISMNPAKTELVYGDKIDLNIEVKGTSNTQISYMISDPSLVKIENGQLEVIGEVETSRAVTVIAYSVADPSKQITKSFNISKYVEPKVEITNARTTITYGETITLDVVVSGLTNTAFALQTSHPDIISIVDKDVTVIKQVNVDTKVTITAISVENNEVRGTKELIVKAASSMGSISISASSDTIKEGETVMLSATVVGINSSDVVWTVSNPSLVKVENGILSLIGSVTVDTNITVTATSSVDESVFKSKTITIKAPIIKGQVGYLNETVLAEISNPSITFTGVVTDYYKDFKNTFNTKTTAYDSLVMMSEGRWYGAWNPLGHIDSRIEDNYRKGTVDGVRDEYGNVGHALEMIYVNSKNEISYSTVKNYRSVPAVWESQHLWNHLGNLVIDEFEYSPEDELHTYTVKSNDENALYLMTYLSYSLTPMLSDTLQTISFKIEDGHVTEIIARTEMLYYGADANQDPDAVSYTEVVLKPTNIGTTVVPNPEKYQASENGEILAAALEKMKQATNYSYLAQDTTTHAPSGDSGDYEVSANVSDSTTARYKSRDILGSAISYSSVKNNTSSTGIVGDRGWVTAEAILIAKTGKYSYGLDDKLYHTEYSGYKANADSTYDIFSYDTNLQTLAGTRKVNGLMSEVLPTFDFSSDIFRFVGTSGVGSSLVYKFELQANKATRDVAMASCLHSYAKDATEDIESITTIIVDKDSNLVSIQFPYSLNGTYFGYIKTTFMDVNTTVIPEGAFEGYVPRVWRTTWDLYTCKYFSPNHSTLNSGDENALAVFEHVFEEEVANLPSAEVFVKVFDDLVYGPFYDWKEGADGNFIDYVSINVQSSEYDENSVITNYTELMDELITELQNEGYTLDQANTDTSGGKTGLGDRYVTLTKGGVEIVITNNRTKHLSIYFYHLGDWILK